MAENSKIEWTHHTFNPWRGCTKVSDGCKHCYAETLSHRNPRTLAVWGPRGTRVVAAEAYWRQPLQWNAAAVAAGERHRVFCASLADVFEGPETMPVEAWPTVRAALARLLNLVRLTPHLDWLMLTKRPENVTRRLADVAMGLDLDATNETRAWLRGWLGGEPPPNVWLGTSVEDQAAADERIPHLLQCPAAVRFLSCEPLIGAVDLTCIRLTYDPLDSDDNPAILNAFTECVHHPETVMFKPETTARPSGINCVIVGGESGGKARLMHPDWARSLRDQCLMAGVPFFFKQWGEYLPPLQDGAPGEAQVLNASDEPLRVGKRAAGRLLDGRTWNDLPSPHFPF